jgi:hypothetical protein
MENKLSLKSFSSGINRSINESLMKPYEAYNAINCDIGNGSLKTFPVPIDKYDYSGTQGNTVHTLTTYYGTNTSFVVVGIKGYFYSGDLTQTIATSANTKHDYVNFEYNGEKIIVLVSDQSTPFIYNGTLSRQLKNRRKIYDDNGNLTGYADANGVIYANESDVPTKAPSGAFIELHYDRLWISGETANPD